MNNKIMIGENVKKVTVHPVKTCGLDVSVDEIAKKLRESKERRIFVVDKSGKLAGIITTTDLVYKALSDCAKAKTMKASEIMVKNVKSVDVSDDLDKALEIMNELKTFNCPVVENGKIIGVISYHELVNYVFDSLK